MEFSKEKHEQPTSPTLEVIEGGEPSDRERLESLYPEELVDFRDFLLAQYSSIEKHILLVNDVLDGYGYEDEGA